MNKTTALIESRLQRLRTVMATSKSARSLATEMLMSGMPIQELQELLGHKDITTTQIYAHCLPRLTMRRESPLDRITGESNILPFNADITTITRRSA